MIVLLLTAGLLSAAMAQTTSAAPAPSAPQTTNPPTQPVIDKPAPPELSKEKIPLRAKVYISPLNGYESFLVAAFMKKDTPLIVVNSRDKADYEITGVSETVQAGWAKMFFLGSQQSNEQASIVMTNLKTGISVWGYNVNKTNSFKGKQSSSEACAKHLKARIEGRE